MSDKYIPESVRTEKQVISHCSKFEPSNENKRYFFSETKKNCVKTHLKEITVANIVILSPFFDDLDLWYKIQSVRLYNEICIYR